MRRVKKERYAGPCSACPSCIDYEDGVCLLLGKIYFTNEAASKSKKCVAWQPRKKGE